MDIDDSIRSYMARQEKFNDLLIELRKIIKKYPFEETLKWGEPSYLVKNGSTIRIDWKSKTPDQYAMYFKCTSKLVPVFRSLFKNTLNLIQDFLADPSRRQA